MDLQMCKKFLRGVQMPSVFAMETRSNARELVHLKSRGAGDSDNAMRRIEQEYGLPYGTQWSLFYRTPKDVLTSIYFGFKEALAAERQKQMRRYEHEREIAETIVGSRSRLLRSSDAMAGHDTGADHPVSATLNSPDA